MKLKPITYEFPARSVDRVAIYSRPVIGPVDKEKKDVDQNF